MVKSALSLQSVQQAWIDFQKYVKIAVEISEGLYQAGFGRQKVCVHMGVEGNRRYCVQLIVESMCPAGCRSKVCVLLV